MKQIVSFIWCFQKLVIFTSLSRRFHLFNFKTTRRTSIAILIYLNIEPESLHSAYEIRYASFEEINPPNNGSLLILSEC